MRRIFYPSAHFFFLSSLHLNAPNHYYSIRFFFSSLFYLMCFNLYIKNVNARAEAGKWNVIDGEATNMATMLLEPRRTQFLRTHDLGIPDLVWERSSIETIRAGSNILLAARWCFSLLCCRQALSVARTISKPANGKMWSIILSACSVCSHFRLSFVFVFTESGWNSCEKIWLIDVRRNVCGDGVCHRQIWMWVCQIKLISIGHCRFIIYILGTLGVFGTTIDNLWRRNCYSLLRTPSDR